MHKKGFTLIELLIVVAIIAVVAGGAVSLLGGLGSDFFYSREVSGRVLTEPKSRFVAGSGESPGVEKISIKLELMEADSTVTSVASGPSGSVIECLSTRCTQVEVRVPQLQLQAHRWVVGKPRRDPVQTHQRDSLLTGIGSGV